MIKIRVFVGAIFFHIIFTISQLVFAEADSKKFFAAVDKGSLEEVKRLLDAGVDINATNYAKQTALMRAVIKGYNDIAQFLIDKGADVNAKDFSNDTAWILAIQYGNVEMLPVLMNKGADVNVVDYYGRTPIMLAKYYGYADIIKLLKGDPIPKILEEGDYTLIDTELVPAMLENLSKEQLRVMRNTMYAKYGYRFKSKDLKDHFSQFEWYKPQYDNMDAFLTLDEKLLIEHILKLEERTGVSLITENEIKSIICGFWGDVPPPVPAGVSGYQFNTDMTYTYSDVFSGIVSGGKWKLVGSAVYIDDEDWKEIGNISTYKSGCGAFPETIKFNSQPYFRLGRCK